jgi:hypothetical protein
MKIPRSLLYITTCALLLLGSGGCATSSSVNHTPSTDDHQFDPMTDGPARKPPFGPRSNKTL